MVEELKNKGFNTEQALHYCSNMETIYKEVLKTALEEGQEKLPLLDLCILNQEYERYRIEIHGLKNVAETIGATDLYTLSNAINTAAKQQKWDVLEAEHDKLKETYVRTLEDILSVLR